jgi:predicted nucleic acid-binding protein
MTKISVDTNILIFIHDKLNIEKREIAQQILSENPAISTQVISEYINTTRRLLPDFKKEDLLLQTAELFSECPVAKVTSATLVIAAELIKKYQFQIFDAVIVASGIESGCNVLYSEDMHHGLIVNKTLTIINPFKK